MPFMDSETTKSAAENIPKPPENSELPKLPKEIGGPKGKEPTRYGDWEVNGRCSDF